MSLPKFAAPAMLLTAMLALGACGTNACQPVAGLSPTIPARPIPPNPEAAKGMTFTPSAGGY